MAPASWRPVSAPRPWRRPVRGACLDLAKRESRTRTGRPAGRNGGAHCPPTRWLGRSRPGRWLDRHGDGRFDPASWGQDAPPSPPRPGSATPATPIARSERKRSDAWCSWPRRGRSEGACLGFRVARISDTYRPPSRAERWSVLPSTRWLEGRSTQRVRDNAFHLPPASRLPARSAGSARGISNLKFQI